MLKFKRLPKRDWKAISDKLSKRSKRGWVIRHEIMKNGEVDADTIRWRFLSDRKGKPAGALLFMVGESKDAATIIHSKRRHDAYDVLLNGELVCSGGRAKVGIFLGSLLP